MEEEAARAGEHAGDKDRHANQNHDERCMDAQVEHNWGGRFRLVSVPSCHGRVMSLVGDLDNDESVGAILRNVGLERSSLTLGTFVEERDGSHPLWENIECVELHSCGSREYTITVHGERNFYDIRLTISRILPYVLTHTPNGEKCPDGSIAKTDFTVTREALIKKQHVNPGTFGKLVFSLLNTICSHSRFPVMKVSAFSLGSAFDITKAEDVITGLDEVEEDGYYPNYPKTPVETHSFHCDLPPTSESKMGLSLYPESSCAVRRRMERKEAFGSHSASYAIPGNPWKPGVVGTFSS
jgi:hypothetical protein